MKLGKSNSMETSIRMLRWVAVFYNSRILGSLWINAVRWKYFRQSGIAFSDRTVNLLNDRNGYSKWLQSRFFYWYQAFNHFNADYRAFVYKLPRYFGSSFGYSRGGEKEAISCVAGQNRAFVVRSVCSNLLYDVSQNTLKGLRKLLSLRQILEMETIIFHGLRNIRLSRLRQEYFT